jgi:cholesterol transport system auxiliary component
MKYVASFPYAASGKAIFCLLFSTLTACGALQPPARPLVYDFGPGALTAPTAARASTLPALLLADVDAPPALDTTAVLYRLAYTEAQQLRPYAQARWSMPASQLVRQRLREHLSQHRVVLGPTQTGAAQGSVLVLRVELEEFSQLFDSASQSSGLLRLRATLGQTGVGGERVLAQRSFVAQRPSASADAPGGVRALTQAVDAVVGELTEWVERSAQ